MKTIFKNELRIGNWVRIKNLPRQCFAQTTITESCFDGNYIENNFAAIPLSTLWLKDFGFETDKITYWKNGFVIGFYIDGFYHLPNGLSAERGEKIKTVHHLQNLFAIETGGFLKLQ